jgi:transposase
MLNIHPPTRVFICSQVIDMRFSFDALSGLVTSHFGMNPISGHIFVFFSRRRDRMKLLFWDSDGFALYYKRLERGTFAWIQDLDLEEGGEIQASDFSMILAGINPCSTEPRHHRKRSKAPHIAPLQLV